MGNVTERLGLLLSVESRYPTYLPALYWAALSPSDELIDRVVPRDRRPKPNVWLSVPARCLGMISIKRL